MAEQTYLLDNRLGESLTHDDGCKLSAAQLPGRRGSVGQIAGVWEVEIASRQNFQSRPWVFRKAGGNERRGEEGGAVGGAVAKGSRSYTTGRKRGIRIAREIAGDSRRSQER